MKLQLLGSRMLQLLVVAGGTCERVLPPCVDVWGIPGDGDGDRLGTIALQGATGVSLLADM